MIGKLIPVIIGWIIWRKTGSIIIGAVVAVILEALAGPLLKELTLLFVKTPEIKALNERAPMTDGQGLRVLIGRKKDNELTPGEIRAQGEQELEKDTKFAGLLAYVKEHDLPVQMFLWEYDKKSEQNMVKAFRVWRKMEDIQSLVGDKVNDSYFYSYDASDQSAIAVFAFAQSIPLPAETEKPAEEEKPAGEGEAEKEA